MSPQELAQAILAEPRITLATRHVSGVQDEATARHNIEQTAAGQPARRSSYGNAPGGTVELSAEMLSAILDLARRFTFSISEIAGASHSKRSRHYAGVGFDVNVIDGRRVGADH
ncbi:MAG TPA: hypothetical protein VEX38_02850, partial [Fimbriimonadaceae bacterium]|nr:hypothetical protein [Fimbriimonadaceae bacterium]